MQTRHRFRVFHDRPTETSTTISIRGMGPHTSARIEGPYCSRARTLRSTAHFTAGDGVHACRLVDPVFWSPEFPAYYRVDVLDGDEVIDSQRIGVRKLECSQGSLFLNSRRWVLRAVWSNSLSVAECQQENLSIVCDNPSEKFLDDASDAGLFVVLDLEDCVDWEERVCELSRFPCVGLTILRDSIDQVPTTNQLFAHRISPPEVKPASWAHVLIADFPELKACSATDFSRPLFCFRRLRGEPLGRAACEQLQRDLAPEFDLAGYIVGDEMKKNDG